ncbi:MAG TPA: diguanylate cyclase, partial [Aquabacterium sp.]|nr:diguanylate cyclase [Aquabacterium sp.]
MMMDRLSLWFQLGCDSAPTETLKRKVLNVNAAAWATLLLIVFFHLTYLATGNPGLVRASWALLPFYPCVLLVPWLNHLGLHAAARWLLPHTITALIVLNIWVANGTWLGIHYYLIAIMVVVPVLFPLQQWPIPTVFFLLNTVLFIYCEYVGFPPAAEILSLDSGTTRLLRFLHISTSLLAALIVSFVGDWMASQNERALEAMSNIDALTNLANRRQMVRRLQESVALSKRSGQHGAVIFLDLDN